MPDVSRLDVFYKKVTFSKFFTRGWGAAEDILKLLSLRKILSNRDECYKLVDYDFPVTLIKNEIRADCRVMEGKFTTPFVKYLPDIVPKEVSQAYFQMILPLKWHSDKHKPICIHLAGTGDHYFWRRRNSLAKPLLKHGIGAIILENPYYGLRKPSSQVRSNLHYVSDIFVMGGCLILECLVLFKWCERLGYGPLGVSGLSMGGHMASLVASSWPKPVVLVPCLSWSTASSVFTEGVMSATIDWNILQNQYCSHKMYNDTLSKICRIIDNPFTTDISYSPDHQIQSVRTVPDSKMELITPHDIVCFLNKYKSSYSSESASSHNQPTQVKIDLPFEFGITNRIHIDRFDEHEKHKEAMWFMRGIMDEFTHLKNFPIPYEPSLITAVCAKSDGYVPRRGVTKLDDLWPGSMIKYIDAGHITAILWHSDIFRSCIVDAFKKTM